MSVAIFLVFESYTTGLYFSIFFLSSIYISLSLWLLLYVIFFFLHFSSIICLYNKIVCIPNRFLYNHKFYYYDFVVVVGWFGWCGWLGGMADVASCITERHEDKNNWQFRWRRINRAIIFSLMFFYSVWLFFFLMPNSQPRIQIIRWMFRNWLEPRMCKRSVSHAAMAYN